MRALWLVALLLVPLAAAEADAETDEVTGCFDSYPGNGGTTPHARLTGQERYVYIPVPIGPDSTTTEAGQGLVDAMPGGYQGTYITMDQGCADDTAIVLEF